jgi:hypothetical protein
MVRRRRKGKGGSEQIDTHAFVSQPPARVLCHRSDTSAGGHVKAPRLVDPVLEFHFEGLGPYVVGLTGGAVAVAGQKQRQMTRGLGFSRDDAVVEIQQGPESCHGRRLRHTRHT